MKSAILNFASVLLTAHMVVVSAGQSSAQIFNDQIANEQNQLFDLLDDMYIADTVVNTFFPEWASRQSCLLRWQAAWIQMDVNFSGVVSWDEYEGWQRKQMLKMKFSEQEIKVRRRKALREFLKMTDDDYTLNWSHVVRKCKETSK